MQGVVTKRHILKNPFVVVRHFGLGVFWEVLKAPTNATFLEIVARHEFKQRRGAQLRQAHRLERVTRRLQSDGLRLRTFDYRARATFERACALSADAERVRGGGELQRIIDTDPLIARFKGLLGALVAKGGPIRAALGTLSPTELLAVESRVLKQTEKRLKNEVDQTMQHVLTQIDVVRAHLSGLFQALPDPARDAMLNGLSPVARTALLALAG